MNWKRQVWSWVFLAGVAQGIVFLFGQRVDDARAGRERFVNELMRGRERRLERGERVGLPLDEIKLNRSRKASKPTTLEYWEVDENGEHKRLIGEIKLNRVATQAEPSGNEQGPPTQGQVVGALEYQDQNDTRFTILPYLARVDGKWQGAYLDTEGKVVSLDVELEGDVAQLDRRVEEIRDAVLNEKELPHGSAEPKTPVIIGDHSCVGWDVYYCCAWSGPWWSPRCDRWCYSYSIILWCFNDRDRHIHEYRNASGRYDDYLVTDFRLGHYAVAQSLNNSSPLANVTP